VTWIGALLEGCEKRWNDPSLSFALRRRNGSAAMATALVAAGAVATALTFAATATLPAAIAALVIAAAASTLIAQRSLDAHVRAVADALETGGLDAGRAAVSHIVGRDPNALDEAGVSRAAIESLAENFSDGVVGPLLWLVVGGLPGAAVYKAINTADSMIGHKSDRYHAFGWAAARLDDVVNLPASRLAACWIAAAAAVLPTASAWGALRAVSRDARHHRSPNAGWPEAAMAGALGLRLAGPRTYDGVLVDDHWMGDGRVEACAADIRAALTLYRVACVLQGAAVAALAAFMSWS
jgi:adenosylcobinamide-phosphate synthase